MRAQNVDSEMETEADCREALADGLVCSILAKLPIRDIARMRIVCKRWNSLLFVGDALVKTLSIFFSQFHLCIFLFNLVMAPEIRKCGSENWETVVKHLQIPFSQ